MLDKSFNPFKYIDNPYPDPCAVVDGAPSGKANPKELGIFINGVTPENADKLAELLSNRSQLELMARTMLKTPNYEETNTRPNGTEGLIASIDKKRMRRFAEKELKIKDEKKLDGLPGIVKNIMDSIIIRLTQQKRKADHYADLGFKDTKLNLKLAKLSQVIAYFNINFDFATIYYKDPRFNVVMNTLSDDYGDVKYDKYTKNVLDPEGWKKARIKDYEESICMKTQMWDLIYDHLYSKEKGTDSPDSFINKYLKAMAKVEAQAKKEFKVIEPSAQVLFVKTLKEMRKEVMAKDPREVPKRGDPGIKQVFSKYQKVLDDYENVTNIKDPKSDEDFRRSRYSGYLGLCTDLYQAKIIDINTFEDMTCKMLLRKPELEDFLKNNPGHIKAEKKKEESRKRVETRQYLEQAYEEITEMKLPELLKYHAMKGLKQIGVKLGLLDKDALEYKLKNKPISFPSSPITLNPK